MSPRARTLTLAMLLAVAACSAPTSTQVPSEAPASVASSAAPSGATGGAPLVVGYVGATPEGWVLPEGETVPAPDSETLSFEINEGTSVMAADCSYAPEPGVGTDAEAIIDALEAREGLEVSGRGTAPVRPAAPHRSAGRPGSRASGPTDDRATHRMIAVDLPDGRPRDRAVYAVERSSGSGGSSSEAPAPRGCPRRACSISIASKRALKLPTPNPREPCRSMISKKNVGRSCTGRVKIWRR